jgi:type IV pilus assembly protein PilC
MPTYAYVARDIDGKSVAGTITAADERSTREQLRRNNLYVTRLETQGVSSTSAGARSSLFAGRVKLYDLVVFSRQLATLVRAGLPITVALHALSEQTRKETLRQAILEMHRDITTGSTMTNAMKKHPKLFSELYLALVEAGELGGMLDRTLETAAVALDTEMEIREKVKSAFVYPIAVAVTALGVVFFLLTFVVPVFANVYSQFKAPLPTITQSLVTASDVLRTYWWVGLLTVVATMVVCARLNRTYRGRRFFDRLKVRLPLFGPIIDKIALARAAHTLASLSDAGVPLIRSLGTAGRVSGDAHVMDALGDVSVKVQQGVGVGLAMADTGRFPLLMTRMIAAGEESGNLGEMLEQVALFFDREVDYGIKRLMTLIEPILTIVMGVVVGFILIALYYPIFNLGNVIK